MGLSLAMRAGRAFIGAILLGSLATSGAFAAGPTRVVEDLNDPVFDYYWSQDITKKCGFPVDVDIAGHISYLFFAGNGTQSVQELDLYALRWVFTNPATGTTIHTGDVGVDRTYVRGGSLYIAITGVSGYPAIGLVVIDLETGDVVLQAGKVNEIHHTICADLAA